MCIYLMGIFILKYISWTKVLKISLLNTKAREGKVVSKKLVQKKAANVNLHVPAIIKTSWTLSGALGHNTSPYRSPFSHMNRPHSKQTVILLKVASPSIMFCSV